jgi:hypothetical protein
MKAIPLIVALIVATARLHASVDKDGSGLSDVYEFIYFGQPADPAADADGDGVSNYDEMVWGTNPTNAQSHVSAPIAALNGRDLSLIWFFATNRIYELQASTNFLSWQTIAAGAISSYVEHLGAVGSPPWRFYRLRVVLDMQDTNGDGLAEWEDSLWQAIYGQPTSVTDIDGDGLPDSQEFLLGLNPAKKDHPAVGLLVFTPLEK